jgi:hypothetical protein
MRRDKTLLAIDNTVGAADLNQWSSTWGTRKHLTEYVILKQKYISFHNKKKLHGLSLTQPREYN